jgi:hypothetical protein
MKRKPKYKEGQFVWLDTSEGLKLVTIFKVISWSLYLIDNNLCKELVNRRSLYSSTKEYEKAMKKGA